MRKAVIFDIVRDSFTDGPGVRTTVFFKGCNLRCAWCHNPEGLDPKPQMMFFDGKCLGCGRCKELCPHPEGCVLCGKCTDHCPAAARKICGREYSSDELLEEILRGKDYYLNSGGGATFSGGECMLQADFLAELLKKCRENGVHTAVDTAGCVPRESFDKVIPCTDLFLYDVKAADEDVHVRCTGKSNRLILDNLGYLDSLGKPTEIRVPFVPGFNSDQPEKIARLIAPLKNVVSVRVLPYHDLAGSKYEALGMENTLPALLPTDEELNRAKEAFRAVGKICR